jgi:hypothetical protein
MRAAAELPVARFAALAGIPDALIAAAWPCSKAATTRSRAVADTGGRETRAVGSLTTGVPESSLKKSGRRCRIGAVVFVAGVRPPTRGRHQVKKART